MFIFSGKIHESFISRKDTGIGGGVHKERASYGTYLKKKKATVSPGPMEAYFY